MSDSKLVAVEVYICVDSGDRNLCGNDCQMIEKTWTGTPRRCRAFLDYLPVASDGRVYRLPKCKESEM